MSAPTERASSIPNGRPKMTRTNYFLVGLVILVFFVISFLTNILGPIIPAIIEDFELSLGLAGFLPFTFFVAYGVMSIPAGMLVERYREKKVMLLAFVCSTIGAFLFAIIPSFGVAMISLFLIGLGMAMLQVVINPLLREVGGEEQFAFNSVLGQLFFGLAGFLSPMVYSYLVTNLFIDSPDAFIGMMESLVPQSLPWVSLYWIFAVISMVMVVVIFFVRFPEVQLKEDEKAGTLDTYRELLQQRMVWAYFLCIFAYVGMESGIANWMSQFLNTYHAVDPQTDGASAVSYFWGLMTAGAFLGLVMLKFLDSKIVLRLFAIATVAALLMALFGGKSIALIAFPAMGFTISVMWSISISLALNSVATHHGAFSGILITGIVGGAVVPLIIGGLGDLMGLQWAMCFLLIPLGYILSVSFWAKPLVTNKTVGG